MNPTPASSPTRPTALRIMVLGNGTKPEVVREADRLARAVDAYPAW